MALFGWPESGSAMIITFYARAYMNEFGTARRGSLRNETLVIGDRVFSIRIRPVRRLDGSHSRARTWELTQKRPWPAYFGCGTVASEEQAKAAIDEAIARHFNARPRVRRLFSGNRSDPA